MRQEMLIANIYPKLRRYLNEDTKKLLDRTGTNPVVEVRLSKDSTFNTRYYCKFLGITVFDHYSSIELRKKRNCAIIKMAKYLNKINKYELLKFGKLAIVNIKLSPYEVKKYREVIMAYVYFEEGVTNKQINDLLGVELAYTEFEIPKEL